MPAPSSAAFLPTRDPDGEIFLPMERLQPDEAHRGGLHLPVNRPMDQPMVVGIVNAGSEIVSMQIDATQERGFFV